MELVSVSKNFIELRTEIADSSMPEEKPLQSELQNMARVVLPGPSRIYLYKGSAREIESPSPSPTPPPSLWEDDVDEFGKLFVDKEINIELVHQFPAARAVSLTFGKIYQVKLYCLDLDSWVGLHHEWPR